MSGPLTSCVGWVPVHDLAVGGKLHVQTAHAKIGRNGGHRGPRPPSQVEDAELAVGVRFLLCDDGHPLAIGTECVLGLSEIEGLESRQVNQPDGVDRTEASVGRALLQNNGWCGLLEVRRAPRAGGLP